jgi:hypothetical protein
MTQEAMKLALEALENYAWHEEACPQHPTYSEPENYPKCTCGYDKAITTIKEAIAELESQEPVAWMFQHDETGRMNYVSNDGIHNPTVFLEMNSRYALVCPLYTHPPQEKT